VEQALLMHDAVLECAVVGSPCEERGSVVTAHIVLKDGHTGDDALTADIQAFVKRTIAPYKYPRRVIYADALPKTQTGKIQRFRLREAET
jgi:2-aminobenzoate-CoA ligase